MRAPPPTKKGQGAQLPTVSVHVWQLRMVVPFSLVAALRAVSASLS